MTKINECPKCGAEMSQIEKYCIDDDSFEVYKCYECGYTDRFEW